MSDSQTYWDLVKNAFPEAVITNFVIIAEVRDSDGPAQIRLATSQLMTPWLAEGMLNYGLAMIEQMADSDNAETE